MQSSYAILSIPKILFSATAGLRVSSVIAIALLLSFGVLTVILPTIPTVSATSDNNTSPANNTNSLVNNNGIEKQTVVSQENDNSKNDGSTTASQHSSQVDPTTLPFPIPTDHSKKIKTNVDSSSQENDKHNSHQNNNNNHNKDSKGNDDATATPLHLPFP